MNNLKFPKEKVIELCKFVHGEEYDYSITEGCKNKISFIKYICPKHGIQKQIFNNHLQGKGCKECANEQLKLLKTPSKEEFLSKASKNNNLEEYIWDNFNLLDRDEKGKIEFNCKIHGKYRDYPSNFIKGHGCHICYGNTKIDEEIREKLSKIHPDLDFSKSKYSEKDSLHRIDVICPKHGKQKISYFNLTNGQGCYQCGRELAGLKLTVSNDEFIKRGIKLFGNKYSYLHLDMFNRDKEGKVIVTCVEHGDFKILPSNFYKGVGCPKCQESTIENEIRLLLEKNSINYIYQCNKSYFPWLGKQSLDFYLPDYNIAIECQGLQHFEPIEYFGGYENYQKQIELDSSKKIKCEKNNVKLIYYSNIKNYIFPYDVFTDKDLMLKEIREV